MEDKSFLGSRGRSGEHHSHKCEYMFTHSHLPWFHAPAIPYHGKASAAIIISAIQRNRRPPPAVQTAWIKANASRCGPPRACGIWRQVRKDVPP